MLNKEILIEDIWKKNKKIVLFWYVLCRFTEHFEVESNTVTNRDIY